MYSVRHAPAEKIFAGILILCLLSGLGCSLTGGSNTGNQPAAVAATSTLPDSAATDAPGSPDEGSGDQVLVIDGAMKQPNYTFKSLGSATFQTDASARVSVQIPSDGSPVELKAAGGGLTWTLSLPAEALDPGQTLTMTPLTGITSAEINGLAGGVLLEPDGIQLRHPARLAVSGPGLNQHGLILSGQQDGQAINFAIQDASETEAGAKLTHFSSYFAGNPDGMGGSTGGQGDSEYEEVAKVVRAFLKTPIEVPVPPSVPLECGDDADASKNNTAVAQFVNTAINPENDLIGRLLAVKTSMARAGKNVEPVGPLELALMKRQARKVDKLISEYQESEEKFAAVVQFALKVTYQLQLVAAYPEISQGILERVMAWAEKLVDRLVEDIAQNHEYKKLPAVFQMLKNAALLGSTKGLEDVMSKVEAALTFEVKIVFSLDFPKEHWVTESLSTVKIKGSEFTTGTGTGQGDYTTATSAAADVETQPFSVNVTIKEFDPCKGTIKVGFDTFGSSETYKIDDDLIKSMALVQTSGQSLYSDNSEGGLYTFEMTLNDGSATAAQQSFANSKFGKVDGNLEITVTHTPE